MRIRLASVVVVALGLVGVVDASAQQQSSYPIRWFVAVQDASDRPGRDFQWRHELSTPPPSQGSTGDQEVPERALRLPPGSAWSCAAVGPFVRAGRARRVGYVIRCQHGDQRAATVLWCGEREAARDFHDSANLVLWDGSGRQGIGNTQIDISCRGPGPMQR